MNGTLPVCNRVQKLRNFKQRAIGVGLSILAKFGEGRRIEKLLDSFSDVPETLEYDPHTLFGNPLCVVALLRQCAAIAFDNHRQMKLQRFADTARPRFADKEIG